MCWKCASQSKLTSTAHSILKFLMPIRHSELSVVDHCCNAIKCRDGVVVSGPAIIYRAPGKWPSDPHTVKAVNTQALEEYVGGEKNAIFFSTQGTRPLPHEIAKGDLDGDLYWICMNEKVHHRYFDCSFAVLGCSADKNLEVCKSHVIGIMFLLSGGGTIQAKVSSLDYRPCQAQRG